MCIRDRGRRHDVVLGVSLSRTKADYDTYRLWTAPGYDPVIPDIRAWDGDMPEPQWQVNGKRYYTCLLYTSRCV